MEKQYKETSAQEVDEAVISEYNGKTREYETLRLFIATITGNVKQLRATITQQQNFHDSLLALVEKEVLHKSYIEKLNIARRVLHRDNLPSYVARAHKAKINDEMANYLKMFNVPFEAWLDDEMIPAVSIPGADEPKAAAAVLSGGQKTTLALSFSIAIWSLFLPEVGFLMLDEPTHFLDSDRVSELIDVFSILRAYCEESRTQIFVVTHNDKLEASFDQVVRLT